MVVGLYRISVFVVMAAALGYSVTHSRLLWTCLATTTLPAALLLDEILADLACELYY